ncbi:hypothetical protein [Salinispora pacifica]|uniref:hypothetical protein n=1 Tax=Salinispora pacifica TaxID=351187 RepID=UPI0004B2CFD1|nr:hypothetical protein [Salinispora pacifica]
MISTSASERLGFTSRAPVLTTLWRLLIRVDAETLTAVLADWLCSRLPVAPPPVRRVLAQIQVAAKSNEIPAFAPLLGAGQGTAGQPDRGGDRLPGGLVARRPRPTPLTCSSGPGWNGTSRTGCTGSAT